MKEQTIIEKIKSFDDAREATGRPDVPNLSGFPEDLREYFAAQYKMLVITEALNEGKRLDYADDKEEKWFPWFWHKPLASAGFAFHATDYRFSAAYAGVASRLCLIDDERARYAGKQFIEIQNAILTK